MSEAHAGMMVTPNVRLVRQLGGGGMGAVWVADHLALRTQVVVKFIASGLEGSKEAHERFAREAAAASQVKSPHVVQTFDHGVTAEGVPYIVMELLEGRDLGAYLEESPKLPPALVVEIVMQLARALERAHAKGIVHRDIKPGNVFLSDGGDGAEVFVKLLDFGIAKGVELPRVDSATKTGSMIGSPFYMSPEQILGDKSLDHRSDLWSVGVLAYEALVGRKPFDAETMGGLAIRIHSDPLPVPSSVAPELPPEVDEWFTRACARKVDERFTSARVLAEELARALGTSVPASREAVRFSGAPRSIASVAPGVDSAATTFDAGAMTELAAPSGVPRRSRGQLFVLVGILLVVPPIAYVASSRLLAPSPGAGLVQEAPHDAPSARSRGVDEEPPPTEQPSTGLDTDAGAVAEPSGGPDTPSVASAPVASGAGRPNPRPRPKDRPAVTGAAPAAQPEPAAPLAAPSSTKGDRDIY